MEKRIVKNGPLESPSFVLVEPVWVLEVLVVGPLTFGHFPEFKVKYKNME